MKKIVFIAFVSILMVYLPFSSNAKAQEFINQEEASNIEQEFRAIQQEYNIEEVDINMIPKGELLKFDSVEDFEAFIKELQEADSEEPFLSNFEQQSLIQPIDSRLVTTATTKYYDDSAQMDWYSPFTGWGMTSILQFKRITFDYKYYYNSTTKAKLLHSVTNINSDIYGVSAWSWTQQTAKGNIRGTTSQTRVDIEAKGFYILGVSINGFTIGAKLPGTIERTYELSPK